VLYIPNPSSHKLFGYESIPNTKELSEGLDLMTIKFALLLNIVVEKWRRILIVLNLIQKLERVVLAA